MTRRELLLATALFILLTAVLAYPLTVRPGSTSLGSDVDVHLYTWTLAWDAHALATKPWAIFDANIFFPFENTLAYSENLIGTAFLSAPVWWLTGNAVLAMNVVALLSVILCGLGAHVLARRLGLSVAAALVCGIIFAFSPARFFRLAQLHLAPLQWMPLTLASLHAYFDGGRKEQLRLAIAFFTLQALASLHGTVFLSVAIMVFLLHRAILGTPIALRQRVRDVGVSGALLLMPTLLLIPPYLRAQRDVGLVRTLGSWMIPSRESFLASPTHAHTWIHSWLTDIRINERASAFLFPGFLPIVLALIALVALGSTVSRRHVVLYAAVTVIALTFCAWPPFSVWPYVYWWPVLNFIRVPSRFILLAMLGIAVLAAIGFERITARLDRRKRAATIVVACALLVAEFAAAPLPVTPYVVNPPVAEQWLAAQPKPFVVAEVPVGTSERYHSTYMLHSMAHWQKTVHGYSGLLPPLHYSLYQQLMKFPDETSVKSLKDIGVTHVVVHVDTYAGGEWPAVERALEQFAGRLTLEYSDATGRVYRLQ